MLLLLPLLQLAVKRIALPIPLLHTDRRRKPPLLVLFRFQLLVRIPPTHCSFQIRLEVGRRWLLFPLLCELGDKLFAQRSDLQLDLVIIDIIVFKLHAQLHAFDLDLALAFVLEDGGVRLRMSHLRRELRGLVRFVERIVARLDIG